MTRPRVSVLMAACDAERFIGEALESILSQTHPVHEVIVVDDGSTDATSQIAQGFGHPVRVLTGPHAGIGTARNRAMDEASGELWAWLDADDRWHQPKLARQVALLERRPDLDAVFTLVDEFEDPTASAGHRQPGQRLSGPLVSSLLLRAEAGRRVGPFDPGATSGDWIDWWSRAVDAGLAHAEVPEVLVDRRLHDRNHSAQAERNAQEYLRVLRARLQRQRAAP